LPFVRNPVAGHLFNLFIPAIMTSSQLFENIRRKKSFLCVGLDTDLRKMPSHLLSSGDPIFEFNKAIVDATADLCIAYKPNLAFYESLGVTGWQALQKTVEYIRRNYPDQFLIADAKRGDIGNTSEMYARTFFCESCFDAVTVAPYMGEDSVKPFLAYDNKWVILLALTSNKGSLDFQFVPDAGGTRLFEKVLATSQQWGSVDSLMFVVGATQGKLFADVRKVAPDHFLLVPGVGAQGGDLREVCRYGLTAQCGLIVNSSRQILYAANDQSFAVAARSEALAVQREMESILLENNLI
jgi:orotidine-5'-phosphate decarboxylase